MNKYSQLIVTMLFGGLAGAIFNHWAQRPAPATLIYSVTTTTLGTANLAIPGLTMRIGKEIVPVLNTHSIDISAPQSPYLAQAQIAIAFLPGVRFFGSPVTEKPTPSHSINCTLEDGNVLQCKIGPFRAGERSFRIIVVTDQQASPTVSCRDNIVLISAADIAATPSPVIFGLHIYWLTILIIALVGLAAAALASRYLTKRFEHKSGGT